MTESTSEAVDNPNEPLDILLSQDLSSKGSNERRDRAGRASGHDSSSSGRDEEAISGWSSEGSTGSEGPRERENE